GAARCRQDPAWRHAGGDEGGAARVATVLRLTQRRAESQGRCHGPAAESFRAGAARRRPIALERSRLALRGHQYVGQVPRFASIASTISRNARAAGAGSGTSESAEITATPSAPAPMTAPALP